MAAIQPKTTHPERGSVQIKWSGVTEADTFTASNLGLRYPDKTVTVQGTFGSSTIVIKGSVDGTNYHTLRGMGGNLSFTSAGQDIIIENTPYIQVTHSGGTSESITVTITGAANDN